MSIVTTWPFAPRRCPIANPASVPPSSAIRATDPGAREEPAQLAARVGDPGLEADLVEPVGRLEIAGEEFAKPEGRHVAMRGLRVVIRES